MIKAKQLFSKTCAALEIAGRPAWPSFDDPDQFELVVLVDAPMDDGGPFWALVPGDEKELDAVAGDAILHDRPAVAPLDGEEHHDDGCECGDCALEADYFPIDNALAETLIRAHLARWLLDRGWQVQASVHKDRRTWKLVDVLSFSGGGGDRLDRDYPHGDDELEVLCDAVVAVSAPD